MNVQMPIVGINIYEQENFHAQHANVFFYLGASLNKQSLPLSCLWFVSCFQTTQLIFLLTYDFILSSWITTPTANGRNLCAGVKFGQGMCSFHDEKMIVLPIRLPTQLPRVNAVTSGPEDIKNFMLTSAEHEILNTKKYKKNIKISFFSGQQLLAF